jgi:hypothetical protein
LPLRGAGVTKAVKNINSIIACCSSDLATSCDPSHSCKAS